MKRRKRDPNIYPDEIFMDSKNVSGFDTQQFEGMIEKPIAKKIYAGTAVFFALIATIFILKIFFLQIIDGDEYLSKSENNRLNTALIFQERGVIYDRNGEELAWNGPSFRIIETAKVQPWQKDIVLATLYDWEESLDYISESGKDNLEIEPFSSRFYAKNGGFGHILGYLGYPSKEDLESANPVYREAMLGKEGIEKKYEEILNGEPGLKIIETDSRRNLHSESAQKKPIQGGSIYLSIDSKVQSKFFSFLKQTAEERGFQGSSGIILDVNSGEVLSLTNYPEYDSEILTRGAPKEEITGFINNKNKPFLNRAVSGLYAPGSIVKPFVAVAALNEGLISPEKQIFSSKSISLPHPYFPDKKSVFYDWKAHGLVDMRKALAVSSDIYFYSIGGGFENIKGLGIKKIQEYAEKFGLGKKTGINLDGEKKGVVPGPEWKAGNNPNNPIWRIGDTYHISIGQGSFQVTPIQMAVFAAAFANNGKLVKPNLLLNGNSESDEFPQIDISKEYFKIVKEGMRMAVTEGTASALNIASVEIAAKTGTAQVGARKKYVNSWIIGFFPYENPRFAFSIVMERGPEKNTIGALYVARQLFDWMSANTPEYMTPRQ